MVGFDRFDSERMDSLWYAFYGVIQVGKQLGRPRGFWWRIQPQMRMTFLAKLDIPDDERHSDCIPDNGLVIRG